MNIKHLFLFFASLFTVVTLSACGGGGDDDGGGSATNDKVSCTPTSIAAPVDGGAYSLQVTAPRGEWTAYASATDWISLKLADTNKAAGTVTVTIAANGTTEQRTGTITIKSGTARTEVSVTQEAKTPEPEPEETEDETVTTPAGYQLVWHDEFGTGDRLGSDWVHEVQKSGWVNNEEQNYVSSGQVASIDHGKLRITCFKASDGKIYSGRVYAKPSTGWLYGYFEARIKLPVGKGTWPAFWMMPSYNDFGANPWPHCGEIDIMEEVGVDANNVSSTIHCSKYNNGNSAIEHAGMYLPTAESDYHVYACEWTPEYIEFFVDGKSLLKYVNDHTGKDQWPFDVPFYPILNLAFGGSWGGYKGVDYNCLPATMSVDYLRVFQKK